MYYPLPFIVALLSWETLVKERAPVGAAIATVILYVVFERLPNSLSANQEALSFIVPCVLALAALGFVVFRRGPRAERQSTTGSSFVNWLRRRGSLPVTTVRSSIRTPSVSGQVDARLDGHDGANLEHLVGVLVGEPRTLVDLDADTVPESVAVLLGVTRVGD